MEGRLTTRSTVLVGLVLATFAVGLGFLLYKLGGTEVQAQADCTEVLSIGPETESQITQDFDIEGNSFRLSGDFSTVSETEAGGSSSLQIFPQDVTTDAAVDLITLFEPGPFDENITQGDGTFRLEINATNAEYTVRVEDCGATPSGGPADTKGGTTSPSPSLSPAPKTPPPAPKTPPPAPKTPSPTPKTPTPAPEDSGTLMNAGGPTSGPMPMMPNGSCPRELPVKRDGACYS